MEQQIRNNHCISEKWLKLVIKNNLIYQFKQIWNSSIETSSKGGNYKLFKGELKFENYLDILEDKDKFTLCRFGTTNHRLPVEVGRWKTIIRENRFCHLCSRRELGDEYHYIFECTEFINERKLYFDFVHINRHNIIKYNNLMSSKSIYTLSKLCKFIRIVNKRICPLG